MSYRPYLWKKNNPDKHTLNNRIYKTRRRLRTLGILPQVGAEMTDEQYKIYNDLGNGDFSYWNSIKKNKNKEKLHDGGINHDKFLLESPEYFIWYRAKENAKRRKMEFDLSIDDIIIPEYCPYLNIKLSTLLSDNHNDNYYSIDRIDSTKGYIKGNVQILSLLANTMKNKATKEQLICFAENVLKSYNS
jgi:hypothetical protein